MTTVSTNDHLFYDKVLEATPRGERLKLCLQCGMCSGICPYGFAMDYPPRSLVAALRADDFAPVFESETIWLCVSCYYCTVRCPQEVHVTDVMYTLKRLSIREGFTDHADAPDFSQTFVGYIERYGRSFELGLATRYHLTHSPLRKVGMGTLALDMFARDRLALTPKRIKGMDGLHAILEQARAIAHEAETTEGMELL